VGAFGYPVEVATRVAVKAVSDFLIQNPDKFDDIYWILFDSLTYIVYEKIITDKTWR